MAFVPSANYLSEQHFLCIQQLGLFPVRIRTHFLCNFFFCRQIVSIDRPPSPKPINRLIDQAWRWVKLWPPSCGSVRGAAVFWYSSLLCACCVCCSAVSRCFMYQYGTAVQQYVIRGHTPLFVFLYLFRVFYLILELCHSNGHTHSRRFQLFSLVKPCNLSLACFV